LLRELLLNHKGGFILSYNDSPTIREWYKDFEIIELPVQYTMGQGETRIGANRLMENRSNIKKMKELLIIKEK
jgi:DNA adenine methylase